jgi:conjugative relaxase-like TrwC/TraI family protein
MLRVSTLYASSAAATAAYYTRYLTEAPGEQHGVWSGRQAAGLGLSGVVTGDQLELLLQGCDPSTGSGLGRELLDRVRTDGSVVRAVSGFDATFSAPKSLSVWWALTGDVRLLEAHDVAVAGVLEHLERFGSTTRVRSNGGRLHPDSGGLTVASFRQSTSRDDDPQIHTHAVISAKVHTADGRWLALDARYLKRQQRTLGGLYQSVLRSELTARFGVRWRRIVNGQAEIAGVPDELLEVFSKRSTEIDRALTDKIAEFVDREGRVPTRFEHAALQREAATDTRHRKSGHGVADLTTRWHTEAEQLGWSGERLIDAVGHAGRGMVVEPPAGLTVNEVIEQVAEGASTWCRADVVRAICDIQRPVPGMPANVWLEVVERAADRVVARCVSLDPTNHTLRRVSDGRSLWIEPTAPGLTSEAVLAEEERIVAWAIDAQLPEPAPSTTVNVDGLDVPQADAAGAVAGDDRLVLVVGPAGTGKTRMLAAARHDLHAQGAAVFGLAPTAKAARVLERDTDMTCDTVAKLLYEWSRPNLEADSPFWLPAGATVVVDEAGMIATGDLAQLVTLAQRHAWRLVLVGDPCQLQAVGRGGLFDELCRNGRTHHLEHVHRFTHDWEAAASLQLRAADPRALDAYQAHGRIVPGTLDQHLEMIARRWIDHHSCGERVALVAASNDHVDLLNAAVQHLRLTRRDVDPYVGVSIGGGERAHVGDVAATRRNDRRLITTGGEPVRNRELWTVTATHRDGALTVTHNQGHGHVALPAEYVAEHVRLGYAATEHGHQSDTVTIGVELAGPATTRRGLYVAATRGREENWIHVITDTPDVAEARDILDGILAVDRADIPAVTQRQRLAQQDIPQRSTRRAARSGRCPIPDWFEPLRAQLRRQLADAEHEAAATTAERQRIASELDAARHGRDRLDAPTRRERRQLAAAQHDRDDAHRDLTLARQRLQARGIRGRRGARREVAAAENRHRWATHTLEQLQAVTSRRVVRYWHAERQLRDLTEQRRNHDTRETLDRYTATGHIPHLRQQVEALDSWWRFAIGDTIQTNQLATLAYTLGSVNGAHADACRRLADSVDDYARHVGVRPPANPAPARRILQPPDLGIEPPGLGIEL